MKPFTKFLKEENAKDKTVIYYHNNSLARRRTPEQNEQARQDKKTHFENKWRTLLEQCETDAQRNYCNDILERLHLIR